MTDDGRTDGPAGAFAEPSPPHHVIAVGSVEAADGTSYAEIPRTAPPYGGGPPSHPIDVLIPYPPPPPESRGEVWTGMPEPRRPSPEHVTADPELVEQPAAAGRSSGPRKRLVLLTAGAVVVAAAAAVGVAVWGGPGRSPSAGPAVDGVPAASGPSASTGGTLAPTADGNRRPGGLGGNAAGMSTRPGASVTPSSTASGASPSTVPGRGAGPAPTDSSGIPASVSPPTATTAPTTGEGTPLTVAATWVLVPGQSVHTDRTTLALESGGDLVVLGGDGGVLWSAGTAGRGAKAVFQDDGNFVVYADDGNTAWSSRTAGHDGAQLVLRPDGDVVILYEGAVVWRAGTAH